MKLSGWGRYPRAECKVIRPRSDAALMAALKEVPLIPRGMGRAYGDSALWPAATLDMTGLDRMLDFDPESGRLTVEAGVVLGDIIAALLPRGWFPPVTPGTKFVTVGGMIAANVHGKNHHKDGAIGQFVEWIDLATPDGVRRCSRRENAETFEWTLGGMGLTGVILRACLRLRPVETGWIRQDTLPTASLAETMDAFDEHGGATYSVAWIDCLSRGPRLGRSLLLLGEHARRDDLGPKARRRPYETTRRPRRRVPIDAPSIVLNRWSVRAFNALYYWKGARGPDRALVGWDPYFYPLDAVLGWNRIYGRRGFAQFQCVLPEESALPGLTALIEAIATSGQGSFLSVLKRLGNEESRIAFPMAGYTLALDFPMGRRTPTLLDRLDAIALDHGGRFYLAKDSRMSADTFARSDARVAAFRAMRAETGAADHFRSLQSERLSL